jgi:hypothetical protein
MGSKLRRWLANLALGLASLAVVLLVLEVGARLVLRGQGGGKEEQTTALYTEYDPVLGWRKKAGARASFHRREYDVDVTINSRGLRGPERDYPAAPDAVRLLTLGDSFVEGQGVPVEATATALLESQLGVPGCRVEAVNGGTIGYSTDQEYLFYTEEGHKYAPRTVVLFLYYNDVVFTLSEWYYGRPKPLLTFQTGSAPELKAPAPFTPRRREPAAESEPPAARGSALFGWIRDRLKRGAPRSYDALAALGLWPKIRVISPPREMFVYRKAPPPFVTRAWEQTGAILGALRERVEGDAAHLLVVYVPSRMEVSDRDWDLTKITYGITEPEWDPALAGQQLAALGRSRGFPVLDLTPALRREAQGALGGPYYVHDGHWNATGQRVAAAEIATLLKAQGWLGACAAR